MIEQINNYYELDTHKIIHAYCVGCETHSKITENAIMDNQLIQIAFYSLRVR